jgi:hypothetical protein
MARKTRPGGRETTTPTAADFDALVRSVEELRSEFRALLKMLTDMRADLARGEDEGNRESPEFSERSREDRP